MTHSRSAQTHPSALLLTELTLFRYTFHLSEPLQTVFQPNAAPAPTGLLVNNSVYFITRTRDANSSPKKGSQATPQTVSTLWALPMLGPTFP